MPAASGLDDLLEMVLSGRLSAVPRREMVDFAGAVWIAKPLRRRCSPSSSTRWRRGHVAPYCGPPTSTAIEPGESPKVCSIRPRMFATFMASYEAGQLDSSPINNVLDPAVDGVFLHHTDEPQRRPHCRRVRN